MAGDRPVLARTSSDPDSDRAAEEEDSLLTGQPTKKTENQRRRWREVGLFTWALIATLVVIALAIVVQHERSELNKHRRHGGNSRHDRKPTGKRNLIFMVSDGMGPVSLEMARSFRQYTDGLPANDTLFLDQHFIGTSRTRSSNSLVTDSAAGATAFSCASKSYNGAISVLPDGSPCGTILEAAKKAGYMTGLVVTTRLTDATPACFASHAKTRMYEDLIAEQMIGHYPLGRMVDLMIGGGGCHFLPNTTDGSCREDDTDVVQLAKENGFNYINSRKAFDKLVSDQSVKLPLLALMADRDIPFEIDRRHVEDRYPSQYEMAQMALNALAAATKESDKGFFVMIEGSRIDHAGHYNDPAAQVHEVLMHDRTFAAVVDFLAQSDDEGVLISTSDHETGGLSAARQLTLAYPAYGWYPSVLSSASNSAAYLHALWNAYLSDSKSIQSRKGQRKYLNHILQMNFGIMDATTQELDRFIDEKDNLLLPAVYLFSDLISRRAQIGWSTHGHSGVDVNIYASNPHVAAALRGNHENTEVGKFMEDYLDIDLAAVTRELKKKGVKTHSVSPHGSKFSSKDIDVDALLHGLHEHDMD